MKIVFDYQIFQYHEYGGISRYIYELASELNQLGVHDINLITPLYINQYIYKPEKRLKVIGYKTNKQSLLYKKINLINQILSKTIINLLQPNIIHETYYSNKSVANKKSKIVLTVYDMIHEIFPNEFLPNDPTYKNKIAAVSRADHIICISKQTQNDLIKILNVDKSRTSVIYLGNTKLPIFLESNASTLPTNKPFLLYVGNRGGYKNFKMLLKVFESSNSIKANVDLICFGGGPFSPEELSDISNLRLSSNIFQMSGSDHLLSQLYTFAEALVYPSLYEGFGLPPLEAMSLSCPVISSNISSMPEVLDAAAEYFNPYSVDSLTESIEKTLFNESYKQELIAKGKMQSAKFNWKNCAEETLNLYKRLLK